MRGLQAQTSAQQTAAQIEFAFEREPLRRVDVQALRAQPHRDALPIGDRQAGVGGAGETGEALVVVDRVLFEYRRQKAAVAAAVGLLEAAAHAERAVGQGEQGFVAATQRGVVTILAQAPGVGVVG
ncbi:hypothetical protein D3C71_1851370 [compost metagenome]